MTSRSKHETRRRRWERQHANLVELLADLEQDHMGQGAKWVESMRRYYRRRLESLLAAEPPLEENDQCEPQQG